MGTYIIREQAQLPRNKPEAQKAIYPDDCTRSRSHTYSTAFAALQNQLRHKLPAQKCRMTKNAEVCCN